MSKPAKKKTPTRYSDRFYDALVARKGEVLRYVIAALVTSLVLFLMVRLVVTPDQVDFVTFVIRLPILFVILKFWVYKEWHKPGFYVARQAMIAVMAITMITLGIFKAIELVNAVSNGWISDIIILILRLSIEFFYFVVYQFFIFKKD